MFTIDTVTEPSECRTLWKRCMPNDSFFDLWAVRWAFESLAAWQPPLSGFASTPKRGTHLRNRVAPLRRDPRARDLQLSKADGDRVTLPQKECDSWFLGHLLFVPSDANDILNECIALKQ